VVNETRQLKNRNKAQYSEVDECDTVVTGFGKRCVIWPEKVRCSSKIKPRFRAD